MNYVWMLAKNLLQIICVSLCVFFIIVQGNGKNFQTFYDGRCVNVGNLITGNANGLKKITKIGVSSWRDLETPWKKWLLLAQVTMIAPWKP